MRIIAVLKQLSPGSTIAILYSLKVSNWLEFFKILPTKEKKKNPPKLTADKNAIMKGMNITIFFIYLIKCYLRLEVTILFSFNWL